MSVATTAPTYSSSQVVTASQLNALQDGLQAAGDSYSPAWSGSSTNPAIGNGTKTGKYRRVGKWWDFEIQLTIGSTSSVGSGAYFFDLPATIAAAGNPLLCTAVLVDASTGNRYTRVGFAVNTTQVSLSDPSGSLVGSAGPFVPAAGDTYSIFGRMESL